VVIGRPYYHRYAHPYYNRYSPPYYYRYNPAPGPVIIVAPRYYARPHRYHAAAIIEAGRARRVTWRRLLTGASFLFLYSSSAHIPRSFPPPDPQAFLAAEPATGRVIVIAPTRAACETIELALGLKLETLLEREHGDDIRRLAGSGQGFGIVAGTGTGKTLAIRAMAEPS